VESVGSGEPRSESGVRGPPSESEGAGGGRLNSLVLTGWVTWVVRVFLVLRSAWCVVVAVRGSSAWQCAVAMSGSAW
jgi:hypothetical protein